MEPHEIFPEIKSLVFQFYSKYYEPHGLSDCLFELDKTIDKAINDIKSYDAALKLRDTIITMAKKSQKYDIDNSITNFAPGFYKIGKLRDNDKYTATMIKLEDIIRTWKYGEDCICKNPYLYWEKHSWYIYGIEYKQKRLFHSTSLECYVWKTMDREQNFVHGLDVNYMITDFLRGYEDLLEIEK